MMSDVDVFRPGVLDVVAAESYDTLVVTIQRDEWKLLIELKSMFEKQAGVERFDLIQTFHAWKLKEGKSVSSYVLKMNGHVEQLKRLGYVVPQDLSVALIMASLDATPQVMAIQCGRIQKANKKLLNAKAKGKGKGKGKDKSYMPKPKNPKPSAKEHPAKDDACHHCKEVGHCERNCHAYLAELIKKKKQVGTASSSCIFQLTPPYTPQHNGVSERRNRTLLDIVRSMINLTTLPLSFWDYALETTTRILNMVLTKKGCEALVKRDTLDKLQQRSVKCIFIRYPKEIMGYYFYFPPENKIVVARYALSHEVSGRAKELEEIQDKDSSPSENTNEIPMEVEGFEPPQEEVVPICRSARTHRAPDHLCLNVEVEEHSLGDLNEPTNYKVAMLDPESDKWLNAMNAEMQSMKDNQVWRLVDLPPNCKTVGSKWLFKKRTDMNDIACGSNVTFLILYVDDIIIMGNHIPSLQSVKSYLEKCFAIKVLWEAAFILGIKIYRDRSKQLIGLSQSAYMDKILKRFRMNNSKRGYIPMQERLDLNKRQGASTPEEVKRMQNVPYASVVGSIINIKDMILDNDGNPKAELKVDCYCNAGFETNRDDIKSQTGYVSVLNRGAVEWKNSKQIVKTPTKGTSDFALCYGESNLTVTRYVDIDYAVSCGSARKDNNVKIDWASIESSSEIISMYQDTLYENLTTTTWKATCNAT
ncbi:retrotransposon protein, putative, ty1-copia subclass [Tanacetum coccineum]